jgi:hypothetical protein
VVSDLLELCGLYGEVLLELLNLLGEVLRDIGHRSLSGGRTTRTEANHFGDAVCLTWVLAGFGFGGVLFLLKLRRYRNCSVRKQVYEKKILV